MENLLEAGEQTLDPDQKKIQLNKCGLVKWKGQGWGKEDAEAGIHIDKEDDQEDGEIKKPKSSVNPTTAGGQDYLQNQPDGDVAKQQAITQGLIDGETSDDTEVEIKDGVDRSGFDKKSKKQKDAPNGPTSQQILDDLNEGNIDKLIEYQNEVEKNRVKGIAGAGGAVASEGESKYCNACNLDKEQWKKDNESELQTLKDELRDKKRTADEERTAAALGLEVDSPEFLDVLAEAQLFCNQKTAEVKADKSSVFYLKDKKGFGGNDDAYCDWMKVGYLGAIVLLKLD